MKVTINERENEIDGVCPNCPAFGLHCPHKVNGDPYYYDCRMTVYTLEKENTELKELIKKYNKSNMICFAADMVYKALNPKSSMDTPNCVYIKMESELENWEDSK